jgi:nucleoside-diphosphate-sugar epimerase
MLTVMNVFITGGTGYIGRRTIKALVRGGHEVTALARNDNGAELVSQLGATPVHGELTDLDVLRDAAKQADGVIHLAQHRGDEVVEADRAAAKAMQEAGGVYVHTGGTWVYGDTGGVVGEDGPLNPPAIVAWRLDNEREVVGRGGIVIMPGLVYGDNAGLIEACFAEPARENGVVRYIGDGQNHWGLVHVDDIADLYVRALNARPGSVYIGVGDARPTMIQVAEALAQGLRVKAAPVSLDEARVRMGPIADAFALDQRLTSARAQADLGWRPQYNDPLNDLAQR